MKHYIKELSNMTNTYISAYPNAGLPNELGEYDDSPEFMAKEIYNLAIEEKANGTLIRLGTTQKIDTNSII